jgi:hypothetical protein
MDTEPITTEAGDNDIGAGSDAELGAIYDAHNSETAESSAESDADTSIGRAPRTQPKTSEPQKFATGVDAPQAWAADKRGLWNALSTEARHYITQREQEAHTRITEMGRQLSELQNAGHQAKNGTGSDVLAAYEQHRQAGVVPRHNDGRELQPNEIIEGALSLDQALRQNPAGVIQALAQAHGIDLSGFGGPQVDPAQIRAQVHAQVHAQYEQAIAQQQAQQRAQRRIERNAGPNSRQRSSSKPTNNCCVNFCAAGVRQFYGRIAGRTHSNRRGVSPFVSVAALQSAMALLAPFRIGV